MATVVFGAWWLVDFIGERKSKRYDLSELERVHNMRILEEEQFPELDETADIYCANCGFLYAPKFLQCPNCKAAPGHRCG